MRRSSALWPYAAWAVSAALTIVAAIVLRTTLTALADAVNKSRPIELQAERGWMLSWTVPAVSQFSALVLGALALGLTVAYDYVYRRAHSRGQLRKRFVTITAVDALVLVGCEATLGVLRWWVLNR